MGSVTTVTKWDTNPLSVDCPKRVNKNEAHAVEEITKDVSDIDLCAVISEVNMVDSNPNEWWLETGATRHVCCNKESFAGLTLVENGEKLYMGNSAASKIKGHGTVILKMTSGKEVNSKMSCMYRT